MLAIDKIFNKVTKGDHILTLTDVTWSDYEEFTFYLLEGDRYIEESYFLLSVRSQVIIEYINRGLTESPLDIDRNWLEELDRGIKR